jgi:hypothetical protein
MSTIEDSTYSYSEEIRLSRELAKAIQQEIDMYGKVVPQSVLTTYEALKKHYAWQIENGVQ